MKKFFNSFVKFDWWLSAVVMYGDVTDCRLFQQQTLCWGLMLSLAMMRVGEKGDSDSITFQKAAS